MYIWTVNRISAYQVPILYSTAAVCVSSKRAETRYSDDCALYSIMYRMSDTTRKIIVISMSVNFLSNQPYTLEFHYNNCCCFFFRKLEISVKTSCVWNAICVRFSIDIGIYKTFKPLFLSKNCVHTKKYTRARTRRYVPTRYKIILHNE